MKLRLNEQFRILELIKVCESIPPLMKPKELKDLLGSVICCGDEGIDLHDLNAIIQLINYGVIVCDVITTDENDVDETFKGVFALQVIEIERFRIAHNDGCYESDTVFFKSLSFDNFHIKHANAPDIMIDWFMEFIDNYYEHESISFSEEMLDFAKSNGY